MASTVDTDLFAFTATAGEVIFLGIQPDIVGFYYPMTQPVKEAVARVYQQLAGWQGKGGFTQLEAADD